MSCREIAKTYNIGKTQEANVLKDVIILRAEYENLKIQILYSWFKKCEASGIYVNGPLLK